MWTDQESSEDQIGAVDLWRASSGRSWLASLASACLLLLVMRSVLAEAEVCRRPPRTSAMVAEIRLDLNEASEAELESLPEIGPVLARAILAHRPYASVDELDRVPGIGPKILAGLKARVVVSERRKPSRQETETTDTL